MNHFEGKSAAEHLKEARKRGSLATSEVHGSEMAGPYAAAADACRETAIALLLLGTLLSQLQVANPLFYLLLFAAGWLVWKGGRSALLGWARMERLHRLIEEERWEIQHHRQQEREELTELYMAKGFSGKLLHEAVDVMMADDNRLLRIMLEEELGVTLEIHEHPLKQAVGAALGVAATALVVLTALFFFPAWGLLASSLLAVAAASFISAKIERNRRLNQIVWGLSVALFAYGLIFFLL
jgi:hypothetical protein